jgi:hypothetical protein
MSEICRYDHKNDCWQWEFAVGEDKLAIGEEENSEALESSYGAGFPFRTEQGKAQFV